MWKTVLFDLDGTLTDSAEGITKCVQYALVELGLEAPELSELNCFVGPPLHDMFMKYAGLDAETADRAVELYRERYVPTGMYENRLYPSMLELLNLLKKNGVIMGVASSKPEIYVKQILDHFGISSYFKVVVGSELDGERVQKKDVLEEAIRRLHMEKRRDQIVLVGDTAYDVMGANEVDIDCIAVTYGYGNREEMEKVKPVYIAESVSDIAECVLSCDKKPKRESSFYQVWRIMYPILIHMSISLLISSMCGLAYIVYKMATQGVFNAELIAVKLTEYNSYIMIVVSLLSILVFGWFFRRDEKYRKDIGIRNRLMHAEKFGVMQMILVSVFFIFTGMFLNQMISWSEISVLFNGYDAVANVLFDRKTMIVTYVSVGILAPMAEELAFRGLVYRRIRDYIDVKWAIIISSVLFGLYHGNVVQFIYSSLLGVLLAVVYERYKTLWAPIVAHMAANTFSCIMEFAGVPMMPDTTKGFMIMLAAEILLIAVLGTVTLRKWRPKSAGEESAMDAQENATVGLESYDGDTATENLEDSQYRTHSSEADAGNGNVSEGVDDKIDTFTGNSEAKDTTTAKKDVIVWDDLDDEELDRIIAAYEAKKHAAALLEKEEKAEDAARREAEYDQAEAWKNEEEVIDIADFSHDTAMMEQFDEALEAEAAKKENLEEDL